ncbi:MAG: helix-turn-helix transcriptional regulator [Deltaproteobacteria bacterium]|nr:helix-turn-helix transcriptional regulator [Deltaproteobacteria bacterium]
MERVELDAFLAAPIGRFHASGPLLLWAWSPELVGLSHFGRVTTADLPLLRAGAEMPFHASLARPYTAIVDSSRLVHLDPDVFAYLTEHLLAVRTAGAALIKRLRIVRPPGLAGAAAIGLAHEYMNQVIETRFVGSLDEALGDIAAPAALVEELHQLHEAPSFVERVRSELDAEPNAPIATVAERVGASVRTLQRALAIAGTTYRLEGARARLEHARRLLETSTDSIDDIARAAGYSSAISLSRRIREVYGTVPSALRGVK